MRQRVVSGLVFVGLIAIGGVLLYAVIRGSVEEPAIVGSLATAASAIIVVTLQQRGQRRDAVEQARRERLQPTYESLVEIIRELAEPDDPSKVDAKLKGVMADLQDTFLLWASSAVIDAWVTGLRVAEREAGPVETTLAY